MLPSDHVLRTECIGDDASSETSGEAFSRENPAQIKVCFLFGVLKESAGA